MTALVFCAGLFALACFVGMVWIVIDAAIEASRPTMMPRPAAPTVKPGPKPIDDPAWLEDYQERQAEEEAARLQKERQDWEAARLQQQEEERQARTQRIKNERARAEQQRRDHELIQATYPRWFIELATVRGLPYTLASLDAFRQWLLFIFDTCDRMHGGRFPIRQLHQELRGHSLAPSYRVTSAGFFQQLSKTLVENNLLLAHDGGPLAYKLVADVRQRLTVTP